MSSRAFIAGKESASSGTALYELCGVRVKSELPLTPAEPVSQGSFDIELTLGERYATPDDPPEGNIIAEAQFRGGEGYTCTETDDGYRLRFHSACDFRVSGDLRRVCAHLSPGTSAELAGLLFRGNVLALILALSGECALHAGAVGINGAALAFLGGSGMGKSTLTALFCSRGADLIADDLLRLQKDGPGFRCWPGAGDIRLRPGAEELARELAAGEPDKSIDGRFLIRNARRVTPPLPLRAIVIPRPLRDCSGLRAERLSRARALFYLVGYPRVSGRKMGGPFSRQFELLGEVAKAVPVYEAVIPWGPPFDPELTTSLARTVGLGPESD